MPDPFAPQPKQGAFLSFLNFLDRPGQVVRNMLSGNPTGALRQTADILGDIIDAPIPGDWIDEISQPEDQVSGSDLIGLDKQAHPILGTAADIGIGVLTDPLSFLTFPETIAAKGVSAGAKVAEAATKAAGGGVRVGVPFYSKIGKTFLEGHNLDPLANIGKGAMKVVNKFPEGISTPIKQTALNVRDTLGWLDADPLHKQGVTDAEALGATAHRTGQDEIRRIMDGLDEVERVAVGDIIHNLKFGDEGASVLKPDIGRRAGAIEPIDQQLATLRSRLDTYAEQNGLADMAKMRVGAAIEDSIKLAHTKFQESVKYGGLAHPKMYQDAAGKVTHRDELEELYRAEQRMAGSAERRGEGLERKVEDLDVETNLANKLANQKRGQADYRVQETGGPNSSEALQNTGDPKAILPYDQTVYLDPMFPQLEGKLNTVEGNLLPKSGTKAIVDDTTGEVTWSTIHGNPKHPLYTPKRTFGDQPGANPLLKGELRNQAKRDQTLLGKQGDIDWEKQAINDADFDDWARGRGLEAKPVDITKSSPRNYLQRLYNEAGETGEYGTKRRGLSKALKERSITTDEDLAGFINSPAFKEQGLEFERDSLKSLLSANDQNARVLVKAQVARQVLGDKFKNLVEGVVEPHPTIEGKTVSTAASTKYMEAIEDLAKADPDTARFLANVYNGAEARTGILAGLAKANRYFKPSAVYGVVIPKFGSITRNAISGAWQVLSTQGPEAGLKQLKAVPQQLFGAIDDGIVKAFGLKRISGSKITQDIDQIDNAYKQARGSADAVQTILRAAKRDDLADAIQHGVLEGFVSSESLIKEMARTAKKKKFFDLYDAPAAMFQGVEQRMRLANFLELHGGRPSAEAAQITKSSFLDYGGHGSGRNRTLRDILPFAQFLTKTVEQQSKFLTRNPAYAVGLAGLMGDDSGSPIYPYMQGRLNVPIGKDERGDSQYVSGFGLPFEALASVPNLSAGLNQFGRDVEKNIIGSTQPLLKTAYSVFSGEDPTFQSTYGSYSKVPIIGEAGAAGQAYNKLAGTGLIQPIDSALRFAGKLTDPRHDIGTRALDTLTGANVVSVDPDRALQQQLEQTLKQNPNVKQFRSYYSGADDDATGRVIQEYEAAKKRLKVKRDAETAAAKQAAAP